ncbi:hypothetical protein LB505_007469 [Fusarium chuoi]|nr:hypothetical protein LB505_007469 [Fusarium chuoi]
MDHSHLVGSRGPLSSTPASCSPPYTPNNGLVTPTIAHSESGTQVELQPYTGSDTEQEVYSRPSGGSKRPRHIFAKHKKWMIAERFPPCHLTFISRRSIQYRKTLASVRPTLVSPLPCT